MSESAELLGAQDILALAHGASDHRLDYGDHESQFVELRLPERAGKGPYPTLALLHGGCWVSKFAGLNYLAPLCEALAAAGIATWNIEYRRADEDGGGFPGTFQDVALAMELLADTGPAFRLDMERVILAGHSAGGHLALWAAGRGKLATDAVTWAQDPFLPALAVCIAGPGDLEDARVHMSGPCEGDQIALLMGGSEAEVPERYGEGSPVRLLPLRVPQVMLSGEFDPIVPPEYLERYKSAAYEAGDDIEHICLDGIGHHEFGAPDGPLVQFFGLQFKKLKGDSSAG